MCKGDLHSTRAFSLNFTAHNCNNANISFPLQNSMHFYVQFTKYKMYMYKSGDDRWCPKDQFLLIVTVSSKPTPYPCTKHAVLWGFFVGFFALVLGWVFFKCNVHIQSQSFHCQHPSCTTGSNCQTCKQTAPQPCASFNFCHWPQHKFKRHIHKIPRHVANSFSQHQDTHDIPADISLVISPLSWSKLLKFS